jgi:hypothetical protein
MKYSLLFVLLSAVSLTSCDMAGKINQSTYGINRNTAAINRSTDSINRNLEQLEKIREASK